VLYLRVVQKKERGDREEEGRGKGRERRSGHRKSIGGKRQMDGIVRGYDIAVKKKKGMWAD
jgi:hypothetical protein